MSIGCLLTAYRRTKYLEKQIEVVARQTRPPAELAIWHNYHPECPLPLPQVGGIRCITSNYNWGVWPRFLFAMEFQTEFVAIFDDDAIPGERWFENCLNTIADHEGPLGTIGVVFPEGERKPSYRIGWDRPNTAVSRVDILGHAWFFRRDWLRYYALEPRRGFSTAGEDYHLSVSLQKHLGLVSYVPPHPPDDKSLWGSTEGDIGRDAKALWRQPAEEEKKRKTHAAYREAGWRMLHQQEDFK